MLDTGTAVGLRDRYTPIGRRALEWIRAVQEILGHESIQSTQVYTHVSQTRAKEVHARCHPMERQNLSRPEGLV